MRLQRRLYGNCLVRFVAFRLPWFIFVLNLGSYWQWVALYIIQDLNIWTSVHEWRNDTSDQFKNQYFSFNPHFSLRRKKWIDETCSYFLILPQDKQIFSSQPSFNLYSRPPLLLSNHHTLYKSEYPMYNVYMYLLSLFSLDFIHFLLFFTCSQQLCIFFNSAPQLCIFFSSPPQLCIFFYSPPQHCIFFNSTPLYFLLLHSSVSPSTPLLCISFNSTPLYLLPLHSAVFPFTPLLCISFYSTPLYLLLLHSFVSLSTPLLCISFYSTPLDLLLLHSSGSPSTPLLCFSFYSTPLYLLLLHSSVSPSTPLLAPLICFNLLLLPTSSVSLPSFLRIYLLPTLLRIYFFLLLSN